MGEHHKYLGFLTLRQKAFLAIVVVMASLAGTISIAASTIMMDGYAALEQQNTQRDIERVLRAYEKSLDSLDTTNYNWSAWDETYAFIQQPSQSYIDTNFYDDAFLNTNTNLFVYINLAGRIIHTEAFDLQAHQRVLPPKDLQAYLDSHPHIWHLTNFTSKQTGVMVLSEGCLIFASRPIIKTSQQGPIQGTLLIGRYLDQKALQELAETTQLRLQLHRLDHLSRRSTVVQQALTQIISNQVKTIQVQNNQFNTLIEAQNDRVISGYALLRDSDNRPVLLIQADMSREIFQQGRTGLLYLMLSVMLVTGVFGIITYCLAEKLIQYILERRQTEKALRESQEQLAWQASHDDLTGLANRREFEHQVKQALVEIRSQGYSYCLCYLDLDQFKIINDTCGHGAGDELLKQVAVLLRSHTPVSSILARLGGDEFGLLLSQVSLSQAVDITNYLIHQLQEFRFIRYNKIFTIGVSIGVVALQDPEETFTNLLSAADAACYMAKSKGRNRVHVYQMDDRDLQQRHMEMEWVTRLTRALEENRFCLYAQPIVSVTTPDLPAKHYEILVRLYDETGHLVPPSMFIPSAERYNLMHLIDQWVIQTLFAAQARAGTPLDQEVLYAINLSGSSINHEQFTHFLHQQFATYQIPPQIICFEITETVAITNLSKAVQFIQEFKQLGCQFSLDDFGSGMSSFGYLKKLPVNYLKIDGMFIKDIVNDQTHMAMTEAINHIGHVLGHKTIAEFVENESILEKLRTIGVDYAQGYGIAKPTPFQIPLEGRMRSRPECSTLNRA